MRTLSYRLELDAGSGYVISNAASTSWDAMPDTKNIKKAPIKLSVLSTRVNNGADEIIEQFFVLNNQDENISPDFRANFSKAISVEWRWFIRVTEYENRGYRTIDFNSPYCGKCRD